MKLLRVLPVLLVAMATAADKATVSDLLKEAKLDGKAVTVTAKIFEFEQKKSRAGKDYVRFKIGLDKEFVRVYAQTTVSPAPKDGDMVEVTGLFARERSIGSRKIKNEIDASPQKEKGFGLKILKKSS